MYVCDAGACLPRNLDASKNQEGLEQEALLSQINAVFSFRSSQINTVLGINFRDYHMVMFG